MLCPQGWLGLSMGSFAVHSVVKNGLFPNTMICGAGREEEARGQRSANLGKEWGRVNVYVQAHACTCVIPLGEGLDLGCYIPFAHLDPPYAAFLRVVAWNGCDVSPAPGPELGASWSFSCSPLFLCCQPQLSLSSPFWSW